MNVLTSQERSFLLDVLSLWEEGIQESREQTEDDHSLNTIDDLLAAMGGYDEQEAWIKSIRAKLEGSNDVRARRGYPTGALRSLFWRVRQDGGGGKVVRRNGRI